MQKEFGVQQDPLQESSETIRNLEERKRILGYSDGNYRPGRIFENLKSKWKLFPCAPNLPHESYLGILSQRAETSKKFLFRLKTNLVKKEHIDEAIEANHHFVRRMIQIAKITKISLVHDHFCNHQEKNNKSPTVLYHSENSIFPFTDILHQLHCCVSSGCCW